MTTKFGKLYQRKYIGLSLSRLPSRTSLHLEQRSPLDIYTDQLIFSISNFFIYRTIRFELSQASFKLKKGEIYMENIIIHLQKFLQIKFQDKKILAIFFENSNKMLSPHNLRLNFLESLYLKNYQYKKSK